MGVDNFAFLVFDNAIEHVDMCTAKDQQPSYKIRKTY